jgi:hypothetical protein
MLGPSMIFATAPLALGYSVFALRRAADVAFAAVALALSLLESLGALGLLGLAALSMFVH